ncbi:hypothetical protein MICRO11B_290043 [Micrococcus luteus]|nr:hypothetical protein MICRO11B_290043 [Micrococcus luteus]
MSVHNDGSYATIDPYRCVGCPYGYGSDYQYGHRLGGAPLDCGPRRRRHPYPARSRARLGPVSSRASGPHRPTRARPAL